MKKITSIQLKAFLLLSVFSLNTVVGLACAMGVNMGFNTKHHEIEAAPKLHVHKDGKVHQHHKQKDAHNYSDKHSHTNKKDNCCNDQVVKLQSLDKAFNPNTAFVFVAQSLAAPLTQFYTVSYRPVLIPASKYIILTSHPPPQDIRVLIQSFLI